MPEAEKYQELARSDSRQKADPETPSLRNIAIALIIRRRSAHSRDSCAHARLANGVRHRAGCDEPRCPGLGGGAGFSADVEKGQGSVKGLLTEVGHRLSGILRLVVDELEGVDLGKMNLQTLIAQTKRIRIAPSMEMK